MSMTMLARSLGIARMLLGLTVLWSPRYAARLVQLPDDDVNPSFGFVSRLAGNRDLVMGAGLLCAPRTTMSLWLKVCAATDAADLAVGLWSLRSGLRPRAAFASAGAAAGAVVLELLASRG